MRWLLGGVLMLTVVAYWPSVWSGPWMYEDSNAIYANPSVTGERPIAIDRARWVSELSHRVVFRTLGSSPQATHAVNLALHLANGLLVYAIAATWISGPGAGVASAAFLLHPIQTEAVAYAASRSELLATLFALSAFLIVIRGSLTWFTGSAMAALLALAFAAKETSVVMIGLIIFYLLTFRPPQARKAIGPLTFAVFAAVAIAVTVLLFDHRATAEQTRVDYAALQLCAIWRYIGLVVLPIGQSLDHDFELIGLGWRALAVASAGVVVLLVFFCWIARNVPVMTLALAWPLIALAPRLVMRIPELLNEHQTYLPFVGLWLLIGLGADVLWTDRPLWRIAAPRALLKGTT